MLPSCALSVGDRTEVADARREATQMAERAGLDEAEVGRVALIVTEAASNLVKHGGGGELLLRTVEEDRVQAIEVVAFDRGRGMTNVDACLEDGYSTSGSPGTGLGAIGRLSTVFDVYSDPGTGTVVFARVARRAVSIPDHQLSLELGGVTLARPHELVCGDAWAARRRGGRSLLLVVDGLGHGAPAAEAAAAAVDAFERQSGLEAKVVVEALHAALRPTRGAAVAVASIDLARRRIHYCGIGNVAAVVLGGASPRRLVSHNGIAGHNAARIQEFEYDWPDGGLLVMNTDGLVSEWRLDPYPGILRHHPAVAAAVLARDFARGRDDVGVLAARERRMAA